MEIHFTFKHVSNHTKLCSIDFKLLMAMHGESIFGVAKVLSQNHNLIAKNLKCTKSLKTLPFD